MYAAIFGGVGFVAITSFVGGATGTLLNGPLAITGATIVVSMLGLLVSAALAGEVATRDAQTRLEPLLHTAPITKADYLGGRFLGIFTINALLLLAVPVGLLIAALSQRVDPDLVAPLRPAAYLGPYLMFAVPNAFVTTAILFALATVNRSAAASYVGALILFLGVMLNEGVLAEAMGRWELAALLDPFGLVMMRQLVASWTPFQKDTLLVALEGTLLWNRLLWLALGAGALAFTHWRFRFGAQEACAGWRRRPVPPRVEQLTRRDTAAPAALPHVPRTFGVATRFRQTIDIGWHSFRAIIANRGALVLAAPALFLLVTAPQLFVHFGTPLLPTTAYIVRVFVNSGDIFLLIPAPFIIAVYAGELVWREREAGLSDIADATPVPDWVMLAGKFLGLGAVLMVLQALLMAAAIVMQAAMGYYDFDLGLYFRVLFGLQLSGYLLFAVLALAVHVVANQKYVGHLVVLVAYAFTIFAPGIGIEHNMLVYGSDAGWNYSDLRGFGPFVTPFVLFKLYWTAWALLLAVGATLLWVRGRERGVASRLERARHRFTGATMAAAGMAVAMILALGGVIFYNTNVLNAYTTTAALAERRAEYERRYAEYKNTPQPQLAGASLHVEIYPERRAVEMRGTLTLVNRSHVAIDVVHVVTAPDAEVREMSLDRAVASTHVDEEFGHRVYTLATALQPSEAMAVQFTVHVVPRGFRNSGTDAPVAANGTYFSSRRWLPAIGYQSSRELQTAADRRKHGLAARPAVPALEDMQARNDTEGAERIIVDAVVGTEAGQLAVAPGTLRRTWMDNGRRYFHYATDAPIRNDFAFFSAAYAVHRASWSASTGRDVAIEILHHPGHTSNLDRMVQSVQASLAYYTVHFGPYPHEQIRFVEHPGDGNSLHSAPINIAYEEGFSLFNPEDDERGLDFPFAVVAHEVAHQWWGNQVSPAFVEGGAFLSESVAWYSAMAVVEEAYGRDHLRRLLDMMRGAYLIPRARADLPLLRASEWFTAYRKGPLAMYALGEYLGQQRVNSALRRMVEKYGAGIPPLPTSLDLYAELKAVTPDSLRYLLHDLLETNTYWELATEHVSAVQDEEGGWQVTLDVKARKLIVDLEGVETDVPMDDLIEIGVFSTPASAEPADPLHLAMHRVHSGKQRITVSVPKAPARAGIDPRNLLIDLAVDDNMKTVAKTTPSGRQAGRGAAGAAAAHQ
jgi:ABC-2 type transport system permease protein